MALVILCSVFTKKAKHCLALIRLRNFLHFSVKASCSSSAMFSLDSRCSIIASLSSELATFASSSTISSEFSPFLDNWRRSSTVKIEYEIQILFYILAPYYINSSQDWDGNSKASFCSRSAKIPKRYVVEAISGSTTTAAWTSLWNTPSAAIGSSSLKLATSPMNDAPSTKEAKLDSSTWCSTDGLSE